MRSKVSLHLILIFCSLFLWGCSHRFDRFGFFRLKAPKKQDVSTMVEDKNYVLRMVPLIFNHDGSVLKEDAANFSTFLIDKLSKDPNFSLEMRPEVIEQFQSTRNQADFDRIRSLGLEYQVEAYMRGRIKNYSYRMGRRDFEISLSLEIEGVNTHNSEVFFRFDKSFNKNFRTRGRRQRDMSDYNLRFLYGVLSAIKEDFDKQFLPLIAQQKSRHGGLIPSKLLSDAKGPGPHPEDQQMFFYLWPVTDYGQESLGPQPIVIKSGTEQMASSKVQQSAEYRETLKLEELERMGTKEDSIDPEDLMLRSAREAEKRLSDRRSNEDQADLTALTGYQSIRKPSYSNNPYEKMATGSAPVEEESTLNLALLGFHLVYPESLQTTKQYQKLYYLVEHEGRPVSALDLENAGEDVLELEVFSTSDRMAVKKFLEDYFHGISPNPKGQIPAVFERFYLGKLQIGFVVGNQAFVANTHKNNRRRVEAAIAEFYTNNGGITVARILDQNLKHKRLDKVVFQRNEKPNYLPQGGIAKKKTSQNIKSQPKVAPRYRKENVIIDSGLSSPSYPTVKYNNVVEERANSKQQFSSSYKVADTVASTTIGLEYEDGVIRNPWGKDYQQLDDSIVKDSRDIQNDQGFSEDISGSNDERQSSPYNSVFFFDMGRRFFLADDFLTSRRYFKLAVENGYRGTDVNEYLAKIERRVGKNDIPEYAISGVINQATPSDRLQVPVVSAQVTAVPTQLQNNNAQSKGVPIQSETVDFTVKNVVVNNSPTMKTQRTRALEDFYNEMEKMEEELKRYTQNKRQLSTTAESFSLGPELANLAFQILALVSIVLFFLSFMSTRRIPASPITRDLYPRNDKNS